MQNRTNKVLGAQRSNGTDQDLGPLSETAKRLAEPLQYKHIFLTGTTGVFGAHLLKELLATTDATIYCLVRSDSLEAARQRLHSFLAIYDPEGAYDEAFRSRVRPVLGDISCDLLDMSPSAYADLANRIDVTIHSAAYTNLFCRMSKIEPINVGGTRRMIDFALLTKQKHLLYVSTYTVMGDKTFDKNLVFKEQDLDIGQGFEAMTYQQSKFIAETMVRAAAAEGLVWTIVRPGQIFGDSRTGLYPQGATNVSGLFYDIFKTIIETKTALYSDTHYDITPVDYVSRATVYLGLKRPVAFETYHLTNPDIKSYTQVTNVLQDLGYPIEIVSQEEYKKMLCERTLRVNGAEYKSSTTKAFKWWFLRESFDFSQSCITDCSFTRDAMTGSGIDCPKIDTDLLGIYIDRGIGQGYFPPRLPKMVAGRGPSQFADASA